jgi:two-component system chemotaxis response regulator CheY
VIVTPDTRFLVIDDSDTMVQNTKIQLLELGVNKDMIECAYGGQEAWEMIDNRALTPYKINFVISDWHMPGVTGFELLKKVREAALTRDIYFILATSENDRGSVLDAIEAQVDDYIIKPWSTTELEEKIDKVFMKDPKRWSKKASN